jgi:hypothetical protein
MNIIVFLLFLIAALCFLFEALGVQTPTRLTSWGLFTLTVGLALALRIFAL